MNTPQERSSQSPRRISTLVGCAGLLSLLAITLPLIYRSSREVRNACEIALAAGRSFYSREPEEAILEVDPSETELEPPVEVKSDRNETTEAETERVPEMSLAEELYRFSDQFQTQRKFVTSDGSEVFLGPCYQAHHEGVMIHLSSEGAIPIFPFPLFFSHEEEITRLVKTSLPYPDAPVRVTYAPVLEQEDLEQVSKALEEVRRRLQNGEVGQLNQQLFNELPVIEPQLSTPPPGRPELPLPPAPQQD